MCLDWNEIELNGEDPASNAKNVDVMLLPCNMKISILDGDADRIPEECNYDRDKLIEYLGPIRMLVYYNSGRF